MNVEEYFRRVNKAAKNCQDGSDAYINDSYLEFCRKLLSAQRISVNSYSDAFLYFASLNYLNASVKQQKNIGYKFKSRIQDVIAECINNRIPYVRFYLTQDGSVVYCLFGESFCFSFHSPSFVDPGLARDLAEQPPIRFDGVKKQQCPNLVFENACNLAQYQGKKAASPSPTPARRPAPSNPSPTQRAAPSRPAPLNAGNYSSGPTHEVRCSASIYQIPQIIADFQLNRLVANHKVAENIAVVISSIHFYQDLINSPNSVPTHIRKEMFREIITQTFSVVEAVEVEIGRRIAKERHVDLNGKGKKKASPLEIQRKCISLCQQEYGFDPSTKEMYEEYRGLRHNVHLCKDQQIINDGYYTEAVTEKWYQFMSDYLSHLAKYL